MLNNKFFDTITDVIIVFDQDATIIDVSPSVKDIFLYSKEELINQSIDFLLPERYRKNHHEMFKSYVQNPYPRRMGTGRKLFGLDKNGDEFSIDIALSYYEQDQNNYYIAVLRDISDIIQYQNKLESINNKLLARNKELDQFAHIVSHDLKTPTKSIMGLINIIEHEYKQELNQEVLKCLTLIKQTSARMSELIDGILSYSRADQGNTELSRFYLMDLMEELIDSLDIPKAFKVEIDCHNIELNTSKVQFLQVLSNLIGNAIKYHNKKSGQVTISCKSTHDEIEITVKDDGPGIPEKYHHTIFEMFGTANQGNRSDSTGIGLAVVNKLVEQNGGSIEIDSATGKGSKFIFTWRLNGPGNIN